MKTECVIQKKWFLPMSYLVQLFFIIIVFIIEHLITKVRWSNFFANVAFALFAYVSVTFVNMLVLCLYEDVAYGRYKKWKKEHPDEELELED